MRFSYGAVLFAASAILPLVHPLSFGRFYVVSSGKPAIPGMPDHLRGAAGVVEEQLALAHSALSDDLNRRSSMTPTVDTALDEFRELKIAMKCFDTVISHACSNLLLAETELRYHIAIHDARIQVNDMDEVIDAYLDVIYGKAKELKKKIAKVRVFLGYSPIVRGNSKENVVIRILGTWWR